MDKQAEQGAASRVPRRAWRRPLALYLGFAGVLSLAVWLGSVHEVADIFYFDLGGYWADEALRGWFRWDANWYLIIATDGYSYAGEGTQSSVAFFPGYPLSMWLVSSVTQLPLQLVAMAITLACGAGIAVTFFNWCRMRMGTSGAWTALVLLLVYPYAWFLFGAMYGDALFLLVVLAAFVLLERGHPVWAGIVGAAATMTRPVGIAVVVGLLAVLAWKRHAVVRDGRRISVRMDRFRRGDAGVLISITGLLGWMVYLWVRFGEPLAFQAVQSAPGWDQGGGPHTWFKVIFFERIRGIPHHLGVLTGRGPGSSEEASVNLLYAGGIVLQGLLMLGALLLLVVVWRRFGWGYATYAATVLMIPLLGSKDFQGVGRYVMAAFPCFAALGLLLSERKVLRVAYVLGSASALLFLAFMFGRGHYVG